MITTLYEKLRPFRVIRGALKLIFISIIVIVFFNYFQSNNDEFDGSVMLPYGTKVVAFGDSITYGYKVDRDKTYPGQLANLLQVEVINAGKNGELSAQGLRRLPEVLDKYNPQILIICHGGNDILRKKSLYKLKENLINMVKIARKRNIHVVMIGVPTVELISLSTAQIYYEVAEELNVPLESDALEKILADDSLKVDYVHPNAKGYEIPSNKVANLVTSTFEPSN
ncbi:GDSL-type esterase/lipase family protein [Sulfurospirillum sp. 1307]